VLIMGCLHLDHLQLECMLNGFYEDCNLEIQVSLIFKDSPYQIEEKYMRSGR